MSETTTETTTAAPETTSETTTEATTVNNEGTTVSETSYLDGKYKTVSALEDGYKELQSSYSKKLGGFDGTPTEGYVYKDGVAKNEFVEKWGKDNQLSNDGINSLLEGYSSYQESEHQAYQAEQTKLLGNDATTRITNVNDFLNANLGENHGVDVQSAAGIEGIEKLIALSKQQAPATTQIAPTMDADTLTAMQFEKDGQGNRRLSTDIDFQRRYNKLRAEQKK